MQSYPLNGYVNEPTLKQVWLMAFMAALHRVGPIGAKMEADEALYLADQRWKDAATVGGWDYRHNYPLGHRFHDEPKRNPGASVA